VKAPTQRIEFLRRPPDVRRLCGSLRLVLFLPAALVLASVSFLTTVPLVSLNAGVLDGADCNENDIADEADIARAVSEDCNENGIPDECEGIPVDLGLGPELVTVAALPYVLGSGDLDGDGDIDSVTISRDRGDSTLTSILNDGGREFRARSEYSVGRRVEAVAVGDFDGDQVHDVVAQGVVRLLLFVGEGDGTFRDPATLEFDGPSFTVAMADLNTDGFADLVVENRGGARYKFSTTRGMGRLPPAPNRPLGKTHGRLRSKISTATACWTLLWSTADRETLVSCWGSPTGPSLRWCFESWQAISRTPFEPLTSTTTVPWIWWQRTHFALRAQCGYFWLRASLGSAGGL
jgi:hypothetical protein